MSIDICEFVIPANVSDLENGDRLSEGLYYVEPPGEFCIPARQQLDDLTQLFDSLHREKSPTAIFSKPELFAALYQYISAISSRETTALVTKAARHKICHEIGERLKRLLMVCRSYYAKNKEDVNKTLVMCLRSTVRMYIFILSHVLLSDATPAENAEGENEESQNVRPNARGDRRRRRGRRGAGVFSFSSGDAGIGDDLSGVDQDGRELALTGLVEVCGPELAWLWGDQNMDNISVHLLLRLGLHMATQKANIQCDGQSVGNALSFLFTRVCSMLCGSVALVANNVAAEREEGAAAEDSTADEATPEPAVHDSRLDVIVQPMIELVMKSESAASFFARCIAEMEAEDTEQRWCRAVITAFFESLAVAAVHDAVGDAPSAKNIALCLVEVAKRSVSVTVNMSSSILPVIQSESYEVRKAVVTCLTEMLLQRFNGLRRTGRTGEDSVRDAYLRELLFRLVDCNPFVRNHTIHMWERLVEARCIPKRYYLSFVEAAVSRLDDKNYLVRDSALRAISLVLKKNWYGHVLSTSAINELLRKTHEHVKELVSSDEQRERALEDLRATLRPHTEGADDAVYAFSRIETEEADTNNSNEDNEPEADRNERVAEGRVAATVSSNGGGNGDTLGQMNAEVVADMNKLIFYEHALQFIRLVRQSLLHASTLLDSRTERDVIESIKLIVACCVYHVEGSTQAFLRLLVMVFEGEIKIQLAVRDAFIDVIFASLTPPGASAAGSGALPVSSSSSSTLLMRSLASAQRLVGIMVHCTEGEVNAVDRIIGLIKNDRSVSRLLSSTFMEAVWGIVDGTLDSIASPAERRTALRLYGIIVGHDPRDIVNRRESLLSLLQDPLGSRDNVFIAYAFIALEKEHLVPGYVPISSTVDPGRHPVLRVLVRHLCRPTEHLASWMSMAKTGVDAIHTLCEAPALLYNYILRCVADALHLQDDIGTWLRGSTILEKTRLAQFFFLLGHTALKQLVSVDNYERQQMRVLDEGDNQSGAARGQASNSGAGASSRRTAAGSDGADADSMHNELGFASMEYRRHEIQQRAQQQRSAIMDPGALWGAYAPTVRAVCKMRADMQEEVPYLRVCAVLSLSKLMIASEDFCADNLNLLFALAGGKRESWVVKTNVVVALGDLVCVHPNLLSPYLKLDSQGFFELLADADRRVRAVTIQVCSHLVLSDMLRVREHLSTIVSLVADEDPSIAANAIAFVRNLAVKEKDKIGNLIPSIVSDLSKSMSKPSKPMSDETFQLATRTLLERVDGDKVTESVIKNLCSHFKPYSEGENSERQLARNLAFCLSELNCGTAKCITCITSGKCYDQYKQWLRDDTVLGYFRAIAAKAKRSGTRVGAGATSDANSRNAIEEWEARMMEDARTVQLDSTAQPRQDNEYNTGDGQQNTHHESGSNGGDVASAVNETAAVDGNEAATPGGTMTRQLPRKRGAVDDEDANERTTNNGPSETRDERSRLTRRVKRE